MHVVSPSDDFINMRINFVAIISALAMMPVAAHSFCFEEAGAEYQISPVLLEKISQKETGKKQNSIHYNKNGTYDYCHMQINSTWFTVLGPERWQALSDPCQCTKTGAWILNQCIRQFGYNWDAVGCYHSKTPSLRANYAKDIAARIKKQPELVTRDQRPQATEGEGITNETTWDTWMNHHDLAE